MQVGALADALAEVAVVGGQQQDEPAHDQQVEPAARGGGAHAGVAPEAGVVQDLAGRGADEREEGAERLEVAHLLHVPQVTLEVGLDVALHPQVAVDLGVDSRLGSGAAMEPVGEVNVGGVATGVGGQAVEPVAGAARGRRSDNLRDGEGVEADHCDPPRECLAGAPHERKPASRSAASGRADGGRRCRP